MTVQLKTRLISVSDYHKMIDAGILGPGDRVELIEGQIVEMSPIGSFHAAYVDKLNKLLTLVLSDKAIVRNQSPLTIKDFSEPEPGISVLKPREDFYFSAHPLPTDVYLVIEVADSSLDIDREIKLPLYASAGIPEYWIININDEEIEAHHTPTGDRYKHKEIIKKTDEVNFRAFNLSIPAKDIFIESEV